MPGMLVWRTDKRPFHIGVEWIEKLKPFRGVADIFGPMEFVPGKCFDKLIDSANRGHLTGAVGISFPHQAIANVDHTIRGKVSHLLQLVPAGRFFVWDELSVAWGEHYGIKATLGGDPRWLQDKTDALNSFGLPRKDGKIPDCLVVRDVDSAFRAALTGLPFIIYLERGMTGNVDDVHMDLSSHLLFRWARQFVGHTDCVVQDETERELAVTFSEEDLKRFQLEALETMQQLKPQASGSVKKLDAQLGGGDSGPPERPGTRVFEIGSVFDPSTHYDDYYYGVGGNGILYQQPNGEWEVYRGTSHSWDGNKVIARIIDEMFSGAIKRRDKLAPRGTTTIRNLLDIGCGAGDFVNRMVLAGWDAYGSDISEEAKKRSRNPDRILVGDITKTEMNEYAVTTAFDFWEHVWPDDVSGLIKAVRKAGEYHIACICTRGDGEMDHVHQKGVKVSRENSWCLVSGHVNIRTWSWWLREFRNHGFVPNYQMMSLFQVALQQHPNLRNAQSWSARNVLILQRG